MKRFVLWLVGCSCLLAATAAISQTPAEKSPKSSNQDHSNYGPSDHLCRQFIWDDEGGADGYAIYYCDEWAVWNGPSDCDLAPQADFIYEHNNLDFPCDCAAAAPPCDCEDFRGSHTLFLGKPKRAPGTPLILPYPQHTDGRNAVWEAIVIANPKTGLSYDYVETAVVCNAKVKEFTAIVYRVRIIDWADHKKREFYVGYECSQYMAGEEVPCSMCNEKNHDTKDHDTHDTYHPCPYAFRGTYHNCPLLVVSATKIEP